MEIEEAIPSAQITNADKIVPKSIYVFGMKIDILEKFKPSDADMEPEDGL